MESNQLAVISVQLAVWLREPQPPVFKSSGQLAVISVQLAVWLRGHFENLNVAPQGPVFKRSGQCSVGSAPQ